MKIQIVNVDEDDEVLVDLQSILPMVQSAEPVVDLAHLMNQQRQLMLLLRCPEGPSPDILMDAYFKDILINMGGEVHEALEPLAAGTKPWKDGAVGRSVVREHVLEETVDVLFFLLEAFIRAGLTARDVEKIYLAKRKHIIDKRMTMFGVGDASSG